MERKILVVGSDGAIGSRWCAVLKYLNVEPLKSDIGHLIDPEKAPTREALVCTPTETHLHQCLQLAKLGYRILCEKPLVTSFEALDILEATDADIQVVNNWKYLIDRYPLELGKHHIVYRNFYSGKEEFKWNMFQPIVYSSELHVDLEYPFLDIRIDDLEVSRDQVDMSYITLMRRWLKGTQEPKPMETYRQALNIALALKGTHELATICNHGTGA